jgi:hypothetical protein
MGALDDILDALQRHPRIAGMQVGDNRDSKREIRRPLFWGNVVARDAKLQYGLAEPIGRGRAGQRPEPAAETKKLPP